MTVFSDIAKLEAKLKELEKRIIALEEQTPTVDGWKTTI